VKPTASILLLLCTSGCALPALMRHRYGFSGSLVDGSGAPVPGATVILSARTAPFEGHDPKEVTGTTDADGRFSLEIEEAYCHLLWICPPLGVLGGSGMIELKEVRVRVRIGHEIGLETNVPVTGVEGREGGYHRRHTLPALRVPVFR